MHRTKPLVAEDQAPAIFIRPLTGAVVKITAAAVCPVKSLAKLKTWAPVRRKRIRLFPVPSETVKIVVIVLKADMLISAKKAPADCPIKEATPVFCGISETLVTAAVLVLIKVVAVAPSSICGAAMRIVKSYVAPMVKLQKIPFNTRPVVTPPASVYVNVALFKLDVGVIDILLSVTYEPDAVYSMISERKLFGADEIVLI
jgi:hypothetical protein